MFQKLPRWKALILGTLLTLCFLFIAQTIFALYSYGLQNASKHILSPVKKLVAPISSQLIQDDKGFINVLLIGKGGSGHDAGDLADTIMVASIDPHNNSVSMLSVPRDLWLNTKQGASRINAVYSVNKGLLLNNYGFDEASATKEATLILAREVEKITGLTIPYYLWIDFHGFIDIVDQIGGITVELENEIYDRSYPDFQWGYQLFAMKPGIHHLDGQTALKYARSRHGATDFERAKRQQQVIQAMKEKLVSMKILTSPTEISKLLDVIKKNFQTNLTTKELIALGLVGKSVPKERMMSAVLNTSADTAGGFLKNPPNEEYGGASVLIPVLGERKFSDIQIFTQIYFQYRALAFEKFEVINATAYPGVARIGKQELNRFGIPVAVETEDFVDKKLQKSELWIYKEGTTIELAVPLIQQIFPIQVVKKIWERKEENLTASFVLGKDFYR